MRNNSKENFLSAEPKKIEKPEKAKIYNITDYQPLEREELKVYSQVREALEKMEQEKNRLSEESKNTSNKIFKKKSIKLMKKSECLRSSPWLMT